MNDELLRLLGKGIADVDEQQDAAELIEKLEADRAKAVRALE